MPSFSANNSQTSSTTVASNVPAGGIPFSLATGSSYVVPSNCVLVLTQLVQTQSPCTTATSSTVNITYPAYYFVNNQPIGSVMPLMPGGVTGSVSAGSQTYLSSTISNSSVNNPQSLLINLIYDGGQTIAFSVTDAATGTGVKKAIGYVSGYLITKPSPSLPDSTTTFINEADSISTWWQTNVVSNFPVKHTTPAKVVALGDGKALIINNGVLDKNTKVLTIETGELTSIYFGDASFDLNKYWFFKACYTTSYNNVDPSLLRLVCGAENSTWTGGTTDYLIEVWGTNVDSVSETDFKVKPLYDVIYGAKLNSGKNYDTTGVYKEKILGFAGMDYLITCELSFPTAVSTTAVAGVIKPGNVNCYNLTKLPVVKTSLTSGVASFASVPEYGFYDYSTGNTVMGHTNAPTSSIKVSATADFYARAKGIRGNNGYLYVYIHSISTVNPSVNYSNTLTSSNSGTNSYGTWWDYFYKLIAPTNNGAFVKNNSNVAQNYGYQILVIDASGNVLNTKTPIYNTTGATNVRTSNTPALAPGATANWQYSIATNGAITDTFPANSEPDNYGAAVSYYPATIGLTTESITNQRFIAVVPARFASLTGAYKWLSLSQQQFEFSNGGSTVTVSSGLNMKPMNALGTDTDFPSIPEAPTNTRLGSYFNKAGLNLAQAATHANDYQLSHMLQSSPSQEHRTNGEFYGNSTSWFYPTGFFVEKRQRADFGLLNATSSVVQTKIENPVQAIPSATKLLVVGVNGTWEVVNNP